MTTKSRSDRRDVPPELIRQAAEAGPAVLDALLACYPTDEEHARQQARRNRKQLALKFTERAA